MFKKMLVSVVVFCLVMISSVHVYADQIESVDELKNVSVVTSELTANQKTEFAAISQQRYSSAVTKGEFEREEISVIEQLVAEASIATGENRDSIISKLEKHGVYELTLISGENNSTRVGTSDIVMYAPSTYYDAYHNCWYVASGGRWINDNWNNGLDSFDGDIGGPDAYGISYTQTTGTYSSYVMSSFAQIYDQDESVYLSTRTRSDGNGANGFGFRLQDYAYDTATTNVKYVGYYWNVTCTYSESFGSYGGVATAYYIHTYNSASITSLTIGIDASESLSGGISFTIENSAQSFVGYSNDTRF